MPLKALIFDLDGTLIDSAPDLRTACNKVLVAHGRRPITLDETMTFIGNGAPKLIERAFREPGQAAAAHDIVTLTQEFLGYYAGHEADETKPYPDVMETLNLFKAQNLKMALCTNKPKVPTINLLEELGLSCFFDVVLGGDELERKKPDPQMILHVTEQLGIRVEDAIMIGDSPNDIDAAKNAGMKNIAVSYGYRKIPAKDMDADILIDRFGDLPPAVDRLS